MGSDDHRSYECSLRCDPNEKLADLANVGNAGDHGDV